MNHRFSYKYFSGGIVIMEAMFDGQDFLLYLDTDEQELGKLRTQELSAPLTEPFGGPDLGKQLTLSYGDNNGPDGIQLRKLPEDSEGIWNSVKEIRITINNWAYQHVQERGQFGTRYDGSNKVEIINGMPWRGMK